MRGTDTDNFRMTAKNMKRVKTEPVRARTKPVTANDVEKDPPDMYKNVEKSPGKKRRAKHIDIACEDCGKMFSVHPIHVRKDESNNVYFVCNDCLTRRVKSR